MLTQPGLTDAERYIGNSHDIIEYFGATRGELTIEFHDPAKMGLDTSRFDRARVHAHACGIINGSAYMLHLVRDTDDGFELRSRYIFDRGTFPVASGEDPREAARSFAYEMLIHDQSEFTHLSTFLADIYHEFGPGSA
ncbi:DAPG hydrolase family protein [Nonomuraea mangrovi]|uniref:DAPG hydrolase family protein n=1 Tax=Nonomuraea mangrovi TaxID=2316207 RepID=A0ABW4TCB4_9ACTN